MSVCEELLKKCVKRGKTGVLAQTELYKYCFPILMSIGYRYTENVDESKVIVNSVFLKVLNHLPNYLVERKVEFFDSWIRKIMVNRLIDEHRKSKVLKELLSSKEIPLNSPSTSFGNSMIYNDLLKLINQLPKVTSKVFILYEIEGYKHAEIGGMLNIKESTSRWHLMKAKNSLQEMIKKEI